LTLAKAAAANAIQQFDSASSVGLWVFSSNLDGTKAYQVKVPLGTLGATMPDGKTRRAELLSQVSALKAVGNTGLYNTIDAAQKAVQANFVSSATNFVVVITDGQDDPQGAPGTPEIDLKELKRDLTTALHSKTNVPIVTIGLSKQADTNDLLDISRTSGGLAYTSPSGFDINDVLAAALFGQIGNG
jgi:Ca-activated chloride channel family protein